MAQKKRGTLDCQGSSAWFCGFCGSSAWLRGFCGTCWARLRCTCADRGRPCTALTSLLWCKPGVLTRTGRHCLPALHCLLSIAPWTP